MYVYYNPNPIGKRVGDCVIRGISLVTNQTWDDTYIDICMTGYELKDMPSSNNVWESYLSRNGFVRRMLPEECPICYTVKEFCKDHPIGVYLLATGSHVIAVCDGLYYDAWDSGDEVPVYYWQEERSNDGKF